MRLLILTQYFPPEMGAPQARLFELAKQLQTRGHQVTVLTAMPNYPTGKVFKSYRWRVRMTESLDDIRVVRTCLYPSKSSRTLPRLLSYLSFGISSAVLGVWGIGRPDVVLIESPPLFLVPFALLTAKIVQGKAVMMVSDIWPDIIIRMGYASKDRISTKMMLWLEKFCYNRSYAVALTNPGAQKQIRQRFPNLKNVTVISNGVDTTMFRPNLRSQHLRRDLGARKDSFLVGYCGLHGLAQGLDVVIDAAAKLRQHENIRFIIMGDGPVKDQLVNQARQMNLQNIAFYDRRPRAEMPSILSSMDISLVPLSGMFPGTMPSKIYEAMASGTPPIVARGCEGDHLVTDNDAGRSYQPGDSKDLAALILELSRNRAVYEHLRENCIGLSKRFDRSVIAQRTEDVLTAISNEEPLPEVDW